jgi:hypothetical protein
MFPKKEGRQRTSGAAAAAPRAARYPRPVTDAAQFLRSLEWLSDADTAKAVRERVVSASSPETEAEALARDAVPLVSYKRAAALGGIAAALAQRALPLGPHGRALATDPVVLGELREAGVQDSALRDLLLRASPEAAAAYEQALLGCLDAVAADRARRRDAYEAKYAAEVAPRRAPGSLLPGSVWNWVVDDATAGLAAQPIHWSSGEDAEFPFRAEHEGKPLEIRINDFPEEPLYSLLRDGRVVGDLEEWPKAWVKGI